jgi:glycosyltransferase involved in cell wall biosynthesis
MSPSAYSAFATAGIPIVQLLFNYRLLCVNGLFYTNGAICERCAGGNYAHAVVRRCFRDSRALSAIYAASLSWHRLAGTWKHCVSLYISPDHFLKDKLVGAGFDESRIRVIPNPFDAASYTPTYDRGGYALFVGRLIRPKGIFTLLDAARRSSADVVIAGNGEDADRVREHPAVTSGHVKFVGPVYDLEFERLLAGSAFVVVPSEWYDNLPMIVCQAFAHGKAVIASRINGIPEFVKHEENGLLFTPGSIPELAQAIARLWSDPKLLEVLGRGARKTAETVLSPQLWQTKMNSLLDEAIEMHAPGSRK